MLLIKLNFHALEAFKNDFPRNFFKNLFLKFHISCNKTKRK